MFNKDSMLDYYEMPWRRNYEVKPAIAHSLALVATISYIHYYNLPLILSSGFLLINLWFAIYWWNRVYKIWYFKLGLLGKPIDVITSADLISMSATTQKSLYLGKGFDWSQKHTQRSYEYEKAAAWTKSAPGILEWVRKKLKFAKPKDSRGKAYIHGLEETEIPLFVPLADLQLHTAIIGATGAGKTRLLEIIVTQHIHRNVTSKKEVVILVDPKSDPELRERCQLECKRAGREEDFLFFHPAFPQYSVRIDPLKNWNRPSEIASRVSALIQTQDEGDHFKAFAHRAVDLVACGLLMIDRRPNLKSLKSYIEGGPMDLLDQTLCVFLDVNVERWRGKAATYINEAQKNNRKSHMSSELAGIIQFYKKEVPEEKKKSEIGGLISMVEHDREHFAKMIAILLPTLQMLTSGELGNLLSPDPKDINDTRPIIDTRKIIDGRRIVFIGTDSLPDKTVAQALAALLLADITATAGALYNYDERGVEIHAIFDEASEVVNEKMITLLNKGRGAGIRMTVATQTFADFEAVMGSEAHTRMVFGNVNNLFALRQMDDQSAEYITRKFKETVIFKRKHSQSAGNISITEDTLDASGNYGERLEDESAPLVTPSLLSELPDLEYFASVSGGRIIKGRVEVLQREENMPSLKELLWVV